MNDQPNDVTGGITRTADGALGFAQMDDNPVWITRVDPIEPAPGPLHGLTMALKDNIDLAGVPTTAGDPRNSEPAVDNAFVVDQLLAVAQDPLEGRKFTPLGRGDAKKSEKLLTEGQKRFKEEQQLGGGG